MTVLSNTFTQVVHGTIPIANSAAPRLPFRYSVLQWFVQSGPDILIFPSQVL